MFFFKSFTTITFLTGIVVASSSSVRSSSSNPSSSYSTDCHPYCAKAGIAFNECAQATPAGYNAAKDVDATNTLSACICTNSIALSTGTCVSCSNILGPDSEYYYIDGTFLRVYNAACKSFASKVLDQTWTNATLTNGGGLEGTGAVIPSFAPTPVPTPSATPKAAGGERLMISATTTIGLVALGIFGLVF